MKIFYYCSEYISHAQTAHDYIESLQLLGHTVFLDKRQGMNADIAVIHEDPSFLARIIKELPWLASLPKVAYAVWENSVLSPVYQRNLSLVDAIFTPSTFSQESMLPFFPHTFVVPHIVKKHAINKEQVAFAKSLLRSNQDQTVFFSVVDSINPRKNLAGLLRAFSILYAYYGQKVLLVLKQYRKAIDVHSLPQILSIDAFLTDAHMHALHACADAYVSAHHVEGWGLGLSQSMAYGKPVIATGYSGNMEFMTAANSIPIPYSLESVSHKMVESGDLFTPTMQWAVIDENAFVKAMSDVVEKRIPVELCRAAAATAKNLGSKPIGEKMIQYLQQVLHRWGKQKTQISNSIR